MPTIFPGHLQKDFAGLQKRTIKKGFFADHDWKGDLGNSPILEFVDGPLVYAVLTNSQHMRVISRAFRVAFHKTIERNILVNGHSLAISGCFADNHSWSNRIGIGTDLLTSGTTEPHSQTYMGIAIGSQVPFGKIGESRPTRAFLRWSNMAGSLLDIGIGDPSGPSSLAGIPFTEALGGLGGVILGGKKIPSGDPAHVGVDTWYRTQANSGKGLAGHCLVGISPVLSNLPLAFGDSKLVLVLVKQQGLAISLDTIRDKLFDAGFENAVFLDGSDSVFYNLNGNWRLTQGPFKDLVTSIGLQFHTPTLLPF